MLVSADLILSLKDLMKSIIHHDFAFRRHIEKSRREIDIFAIHIVSRPHKRNLISFRAARYGGPYRKKQLSFFVPVHVVQPLYESERAGCGIELCIREPEHEHITNCF